MATLPSALHWIDSQQSRMADLVRRWGEINSGTRNLAGLAHMREEVALHLRELGAAVNEIPVAPQQTVDAEGNLTGHDLGPVLMGLRQANGPRVLLGIHLDTVYGPEDSFQRCELLDPNTLRGPGVADAKGGIVVMLTALEALERSEFAGKLSWEVILTSDEEIGSPGSSEVWTQAAGRNDLGLLFEPALPGGDLVGARKGSGNFVLVVRGKSAHAGRDFHAGRNAIHLLAEIIDRLAKLNGRSQTLTVNVGQISGGVGANVVPALAIGRFNIRVADEAERQLAQELVSQAIGSAPEGFVVELHGGFGAPPKPLTDSTRQMLEQLCECGREIGVGIGWKNSGGVCDGNRLAAAGLPVVDSLGPRGGEIHSPREFVLLDSLTERAKLTALYLLKLASGQIQIPQKAGMS